MNSLEISKKFPYTEEELECLEELKKMRYEEIDLSDIPEITKEEFARMKANRLRKKNVKIAS